MLKHTLILPESDARLSADMVQDAIDALDTILMLVFGKGEEPKQIVGWADQLCEKTRHSGTLNLRRIIWLRNPAPMSVRRVLDSVFVEDRIFDPAADLNAEKVPAVAVLNFHDKLVGQLAKGGRINPLTLEKLFLKGHAI